MKTPMETYAAGAKQAADATELRRVLGLLRDHVKALTDVFGNISMSAGLGEHIPDSQWMAADEVLTAARAALAAAEKLK